MKELVKHIRKFSIPYSGKRVYALHEIIINRIDDPWVIENEWIETTVGGTMYDKIYHTSGSYIDLDSTEEDREERLKLLKAAYKIK